MQTVEEILKMVIDSTDGYKFGKVEITAMPIRGLKVGYATKYRKGKTVSGKIVIDSRFVEYAQDGHEAELLDVIRHELAHLVAETFNTKKRKHIWHGQAWKDVCLAIGGDGQRYYSGSFVKPENKGKTFTPVAELYNRLPKQPATDWEKGTFRQWLERGYHVMKGQKGTVQVWEFKGNAYETKDGEESDWGRAAAVYFTPDQVEANVPKEAK